MGLQWSRKAALASLLLPLMLPVAAGAVTTPEQVYGDQLEAALNQGDTAGLKRLVDPQLQERLKRRYDRFAADFPGASWHRGSPQQNGRNDASDVPEAEDPPGA